MDESTFLLFKRVVRWEGEFQLSIHTRYVLTTSLDLKIKRSMASEGYVTFWNGHKMPIIGLGTWQVTAIVNYLIDKID